MSSAEVPNIQINLLRAPCTLPQTTLDLAQRFIKDSWRQIPNWPEALFFPKRVVFCVLTFYVSSFRMMCVPLKCSCCK
ncbi:hypothetical protein CgunFtcFv8_015558 [Champsocephalus gunnari]|uniref:Uncharacterized protein n=1 Tax=Champsocephalus gunnari TaxID=52237 RepID=A0AAN8GZX2_CHAGU|nr:hypothetical protein CgunFtcFv8_015558 [Champsocephalus gunnari]